MLHNILPPEKVEHCNDEQLISVIEREAHYMWESWHPKHLTA